MSEAVVKNLNVGLLNNRELSDNIKKGNYVVSKKSKPFRLLSSDEAIDNLFNVLETTRDPRTGEIVDTRFNDEIQDFIRSYLAEKGVMFHDTGYQSLRAACYSLDTKNRLELCRNIKYKFDKNVDIDNVLKGTSFFDKIKNKLALGSGGALLGAAAGGIATLIKPEVGPNLIRQPIKDATENIIKENVPLFTNKVNEVANSFIENNVLSKALPINLGIFTSAGIASGLLGSVVTSAYDIVKNIKNRIEHNRSYKEFLEKDSELYYKDNEKEAHAILSITVEDEKVNKR